MKNLHLGSMVLCIALISGVSPEARSEYLPAMAGHSWPNHFDTCFSSSWSTMVNNCTGTPGSTRLLVIPVQAAAGTTYSAWARAGGNGTDGKTTCQAISITGTGISYDFSYRLQTTISTGMQVLPLGSISTPSEGTLQFECDVAEDGGRVFNVRFN